jgi:hypothetical protein
VTTLAPGDNAHYWPSFLPDGRHFLFTVRSGNAAGNGIWVALIDDPARGP